MRNCSRPSPRRGAARARCSSSPGTPGSGRRVGRGGRRSAADHGDTVLWGSAWEPGGAPAYWPWAQVIRELVQQRPADEVVEDLGFGAPYVAHVAPELVQRLPGFVERPVPLESEAERFTAFDATTSFVCAAAARRPLVIVLDDLHAADVATVRLLEFLAGQLAPGPDPRHRYQPPHAARRDSELRSRWRTSARSRSGSSWAACRGASCTSWSRAQVPGARRRRSSITCTPSPRAIRCSRTSSCACRPPRAPRGRLRVPQGVRHTIRRRLDPLPADVARPLTRGRRHRPRVQLETLAGRGEQERVRCSGSWTPRSRPAVRECPGSRPLPLRHGLIRETLYADLPAGDRVARHAEVGDALVVLYGGRSGRAVLPSSRTTSSRPRRPATPTARPTMPPRAGAHAALESMA